MINTFAKIQRLFKKDTSEIMVKKKNHQRIRDSVITVALCERSRVGWDG